jgi:hypothetical protein
LDYFIFFLKVSQSSDTRDMMLKQYIEQIFTDLHVRLANNHHQQQQEDEECTTNTTVVVVTE